MDRKMMWKEKDWKRTVSIEKDWGHWIGSIDWGKEMD